MGKQAPQAPTPPDPTVVAAAQTGSNEATAQYQSQLNNGNSNGPYGSVTNTYNPTANQWTQNTTLSPQEQAIFNGQTSAEGSALGIANTQLGNVGNALATPLSAPQMQTGIQSAGPLATSYNAGGQIQTGFDPGQGVQGQIGYNAPIQTGYNSGGQIQGQVGGNTQQAVNNAEMANFAGQMQLLQPQMQQASEQNQAQLVAQGLNPNDAAYQNEQTLFGNQQATQLGQAASSAVAAGNAEQNTLFGQQLNQGQFANSAQAQANSQNAAQAAFGNQAQQQGYSQALGAGTFANSAAAQQYAQDQGQAAFSNAAQAQQNSQNAAQATFGNTALGQQFSQNPAQQQAYNTGQQANFQNTAYAQQLPINEFDALMSSGQTSMPSAANLSSTSVAPTDVLGAYALNSQVAQSNYASQMQQYQSGLGGLFNLGSAALGFL